MVHNENDVLEKNKDDDVADVGSKNDERKRSRMMWMFVMNMCVLATAHITLSVYTNGVIRTIERRFGLSSSKTGLLNSCNDIFQICLVVFIGYFGQRYNKPRIICVTIMFSAVAGFLMASPHFIFTQDDHSGVYRTPYNSTTSGNNARNDMLGHEKSFNSENSSTSPDIMMNSIFSTLSPQIKKHKIDDITAGTIDNSIQFCAAGNNSDHGDDENCKNSNGDQTHPAFYVFVVAQLIVGIGSSAAFTLSIAYIDENAPKNMATVYMGVFMSTFSFAPVSGFMLATLCLKFPENLFSGENIDPSDPSFIGCWWLGYLIGGTFIVASAIPMWWYPKKYGSHDEVKVVDKGEGILSQFKGIPKAAIALLTKKLYIFYLCQFICSAFTIYGILINLVRYIEIHFNRTAAEGSIIAGVTTAVTGVIGNIGGGVLISRFKFRTIDGVKLVIFSSFIFAAGNLVLMNLACPQVEMNMDYDPKSQMNTALNDCNKPCLCTTNRRDYRPICASNNISYFSPCIAGCTEFVNDTFINCKCLKRPTPVESTTYKAEYFEGSASKGYCIPACNLLIPFTIAICLMCLCAAAAKVSNTMIALRIVNDDERSFALGMNSFFINLLGFVPTPLIFGYLIDKSCILWQVTCQTVGACLMFDVAKLRYSLFGCTLFMEIVSFTFNFLIFLSLRKMSLGSAMLSRQKDELKCNDEDQYNNPSMDDGSKMKDVEVVNGVEMKETTRF